MAKKEINTILIGSKDKTAYILAIITESLKNNKIKLRARGRAISKAVDVSQITIDRHLKGWKTDNITAGTEEVPSRNEDGTDGNELFRISWIEIVLIKG